MARLLELQGPRRLWGCARTDRASGAARRFGFGRAPAGRVGDVTFSGDPVPGWGSRRPRGGAISKTWFPLEGCESPSFPPLAQLRAILYFSTLGVRLFSFFKKLCSRNRNYWVLSPLGLPCTHRWDADGHGTGKCRAQRRAGPVTAARLPRSEPSGSLADFRYRGPGLRQQSLPSRLLRKVKAEGEQFTNC